MKKLILFGSYFSGLILMLIFSIKEFNTPKYNYHDNESEENLIDKSHYAKLAQPALPKYMANSSRYAVFMVAFTTFAAGLFFF